VRMRHREQALLRFDERAQARGPVMRPERGHERPLHPAPYRRLLRVPEQGPHKGQGLPQPSGGREKLGQCRSQNADTRSQNSRKGGLRTRGRGRSQRLDVRWQKSEALAEK
jgi:hypothetical protein